jgi:hypothetical protein
MRAILQSAHFAIHAMSLILAPDFAAIASVRSWPEAPVRGGAAYGCCRWNTGRSVDAGRTVAPDPDRSFGVLRGCRIVSCPLTASRKLDTLQCNYTPVEGASADAKTMSSRSRVDTILAQFPGPVAFQASRVKWGLVLVGALAFVAVAIRAISTGAASPWMWFALIFFGSCAITSAVMLLPGAGELRLDRHGFETTRLFRHYRTRWQDVSEFKTIIIRLNTIVVYDDRTRTGRLFWLSVAIAGHNAALVPDYGFSAGKLADLMNHWRGRAIRQSTG